MSHQIEHIWTWVLDSRFVSDRFVFVVVIVIFASSSLMSLLIFFFCIFFTLHYVGCFSFSLSHWFCSDFIAKTVKQIKRISTLVSKHFFTRLFTASRSGSFHALQILIQKNNKQFSIHSADEEEEEEEKNIVFVCLFGAIECRIYVRFHFRQRKKSNTNFCVNTHVSIEIQTKRWKRRANINWIPKSESFAMFSLSSSGLFPRHDQKHAKEIINEFIRAICSLRSIPDNSVVWSEFYDIFCTLSFADVGESRTRSQVKSNETNENNSFYAPVTNEANARVRPNVDESWLGMRHSAITCFCSES